MKADSNIPKGAPVRSGPRRAATVLTAFVLAALTVGLLAEAGLRIAGWIYLQQRAPPASLDGQQTILCLGDSWTYGAESGDPSRNSYPAQLQRLLDQDGGGFQVINRGKPGTSADMLAAELPSLLEQHRPRVAVVMVGGASWFSHTEPSAHGANSRLGSRKGFPHSLHIYRLLRIFRNPPPWQSPRALIQQEVLTRQGLDDALDIRQNNHKRENRGAPPISMRGCSQPQQTAALLREIQQTRDPQDPRLLRLLRHQAGCAGAWIVAAELAIGSQQWARARQMAQAALALEKQEPHALVALALAVAKLHGKWNENAWRALQTVRGRYPAYLRARRLELRAANELQYDLCYIHFALQDILRRYPDCSWAKEGLSLSGRIMAEPLWKRLQQQLADDLSAIISLLRKARVRILLLNYPPSRLNPCRGIVSQTISRVAVSKEVPMLDLGEVLGTFKETKGGSALYSPGGHPNARGYRLMARQILGRLRVRDRISWPTEVGEAPVWQGARRAHTRRYATDE